MIINDPKRTDKVLVIDHNIYRFHHFDLMESMLYYKPFFIRLKDEYKGYLKMSADKQLAFLKTVNSQRNILKFFSDTTDMDEYVDVLNNLINYSGKEPTMCDLYYGLPALSNMKLLELHILQFMKDSPYNSDIINPDTRIIKRDNILDSEYIANYIKQKQITVVICDSIDMAIEISEKTQGISFMLPNYRYNLKRYAGVSSIKHLDLTIDYGLKLKHTYTLFDNLCLRKGD